jgi:NADH-quinone oxidoreductase subunit N
MLLIGDNGEAFNGAFVQDPFARFMKVLTIVGAVVTLAMSVSMAEREKLDKFEFPILIILSTLGMLLMISANNMISLYMGLELQSLALYVVAAFNRDSARATEGGSQIFCSGRPVVRHAALRHQPDLRLYRQYRLLRDCGGAG